MGVVYFPTFYHKKMKLTIHVGKYTIHWVCWHNCVSLDFFPILTRHFVHDTSKNTLKTARFWHPMTFQGFLGRGVSYLPGSSWANVDLPFAAANGWLGAKKEQTVWPTWILFVYSDTVNASETRRSLHPWRLTWNIVMEVWKIIFLLKWVICRFHINLPGCNQLRFVVYSFIPLFTVKLMHPNDDWRWDLWGSSTVFTGAGGQPPIYNLDFI